MSLAPAATLHSLQREWCASHVTFSFLSPACLCFVQHSYFIAPDINGLPTIPESVSIHGEGDEKRPTEIKADPSLLEPCLPLIAFNQIHLSPFEIIASSSCFSFISCSSWSSVIATSIRRFELNTCCMILPPAQVDPNHPIWQNKAAFIQLLFPKHHTAHSFQAIFQFAEDGNVQRWKSKFLFFGTLCLLVAHSDSLWHWHFRQVCYVLFLSVSRGTWQSTLWLWTSTTCSSSMPACCTNGASSLPQPSSALWVQPPPPRVSYQRYLVRGTVG